MLIKKTCMCMNLQLRLDLDILTLFWRNVLEIHWNVCEIMVEILYFFVTWRVSPDPPPPIIFATVCHRFRYPHRFRYLLSNSLEIRVSTSKYSKTNIFSHFYVCTYLISKEVVISQISIYPFPCFTCSIFPRRWSSLNQSVHQRHMTIYILKKWW